MKDFVMKQDASCTELSRSVVLCVAMSMSTAGSFVVGVVVGLKRPEQENTLARAQNLPLVSSKNLGQKSRFSYK
jgi:hypothetical protein